MRTAIFTVCLYLFTFYFSLFADDTLLLKINNEISTDSIYSNLEILTGEKDVVIDGLTYRIKSRMNNKEGNHLSALYIEQKLKEYGYQPSINHYDNYLKDGNSYPAENITAFSYGTEFPEQIVVFSAHYDISVKYTDSIGPGADDNCSGVVTVLEAARILNTYQHKKTIIFALFDHEEFPPDGSGYFADSIKNAGIKDLCCINVDMLGYYKDDAWETMVYIDSTHISDFLGEHITNCGKLLNLKSNIIVTDVFSILADSSQDHKIYGGVSDAVAFGILGYPALTIIENPRMDKMNKKYHSMEDNIANMNLPYFFDNSRLSIVGLASVAAAFEKKTSVNDNNAVQVLINPNPANDYLNLNFNGSIAPSQIAVYNTFGECVETFDNQDLQQNIRLNIENLSSGIYFVKIGNSFNKFMVIR